MTRKMLNGREQRVPKNVYGVIVDWSNIERVGKLNPS